LSKCAVCDPINVILAGRVDASTRVVKPYRDRESSSLNSFGVGASQPLSVWRKDGWIHPGIGGADQPILRAGRSHAARRNIDGALVFRSLALLRNSRRNCEF